MKGRGQGGRATRGIVGEYIAKGDRGGLGCGGGGHSLVPCADACSDAVEDGQRGLVRGDVAPDLRQHRDDAQGANVDRLAARIGACRGGRKARQVALGG